MLPWCRFRHPSSRLTRDTQAMDGSASSYRTAVKPSGGRKRKVKTPMRVSGMHSIGKLDGQARLQVDWCYNFTRHSTCLTLGLSACACNFWNARCQCTDCMCLRQCKNRGAFLPWTLVEVLLGHFCAEERVPPTNTLHCWAPVPVHRTKGGRAERDKEEGNTLRRGGRTAGLTGGRTIGGRTARGVWVKAAVPAAGQPPETTSLRGGAQTE